MGELLRKAVSHAEGLSLDAFLDAAKNAFTEKKKAAKDEAAKESASLKEDREWVKRTQATVDKMTPYDLGRTGHIVPDDIRPSSMENIGPVRLSNAIALREQKTGKAVRGREDLLALDELEMLRDHGLGRRGVRSLMEIKAAIRKKITA